MPRAIDDTDKIRPAGSIAAKAGGAGVNSVFTMKAANAASTTFSQLNFVDSASPHGVTERYVWFLWSGASDG